MFIPNSPRPPKGIARSDWLDLLKEYVFSDPLSMNRTTVACFSSWGWL